VAHIVDFACDVDASVGQSSLTESETQRVLKMQKTALEDEKQVQQQGIELLSEYARTLTYTQATPTDAVSFFDRVMDGRRGSLAKIRELEEQIAELERAIQEQASSPRKQGRAGGRVSMVIAAVQDCSVELKLTYLVAGTTWEPRYDLYVSAVDGEPSSIVSLHYGARISQSTGEDWMGAVIALCTSRAPAKVSSNIPVLKARKIVVKEVASDSSTSARPGSFWNSIPTNAGASVVAKHLSGSAFPRLNEAPLPVRGQSASQLASQPPPPMPMTAFAVGSAKEPAVELTSHSSAAPRTWLPETSNVNAADVPRTLSRRLLRGEARALSVPDMRKRHDDHVETVPELEVSGEGTSTEIRESLHSELLQVNPEILNLPSDGITHNVPIAVFELDAQYTWVCVPRVRSAAYVECRVTNKSATRFRPGPVNVYVGGAFTVRTDMQDTKPNGTFTCSLGMDNALQVAYKRTAVTKADPPHPFAERSKTTKCAVHIRVVNNHPFRLSLLIRDVAPLAHDGRVIGALSSGDTVQDERGFQQAFSPQREIVGSKPNVRWLGDAVGYSEGEENGLYEWKCQLVPGSVTVVTEWEVQTAANISWEEAEQ